MSGVTCAHRIIRLAILHPLPILRLRLMLIRLSRLLLTLRLLLAATMTVMTPRWAARSLMPPIPPILRQTRRLFPKPTN